MQRVTGDDDGITEPLTAHLRTEGWSIRRERMLCDRDGSTDPVTRQAHIREDVSPAQFAKTLLHEPRTSC